MAYIDTGTRRKIESKRGGKPLVWKRFLTPDSIPLGRHQDTAVSHLTITQLLHSIRNTGNGHGEFLNLRANLVSGGEIQHGSHAGSRRNSGADNAVVAVDQVHG